MVRTRFGGNSIWNLRSAAFQFDYQKEIKKFSEKYEADSNNHLYLLTTEIGQEE
jgi:hypothetical protein